MTQPFPSPTMTIFIISQILAGIALCTDLIAFQFKDRTKIVACLTLSTTLLACHFYMLEQWTASGMMFVASIRYFSSIFTTSKKWLAFFSIIILLIFFATYQGLLSILACAGSLTGAIAAFSSRDLLLRQLMILATGFWLIHNILVGSPMAILLEASFLMSNFIGYYRFYFRKPRPLH